MAQKVVTLYTDDLTGEESSEVSTYTVLVNGAGVEIDLTSDSHDKLMEALAPFLGAAGARRVRQGGSRSGARVRSATPRGTAGVDTSSIRAWARDQGLKVNDRGRLPVPIMEAYEKAH